MAVCVWTFSDILYIVIAPIIIWFPNATPRRQKGTSGLTGPTEAPVFIVSLDKEINDSGATSWFEFPFVAGFCEI